MVQNHQTGAEMTHWDILNKEIQIWWLCVTCLSVSFALSVWRFVPRDRSAANGPLVHGERASVELCIHKRAGLAREKFKSEVEERSARVHP